MCNITERKPRATSPAAGHRLVEVSASFLPHYQKMVGSNIRHLLTEFSQSLDYFATSSGDGRIKKWDTVKGQLQTEFSDIASSKEDGRLFGSEKVERGHLCLDYTCMKWLSLDRKKKRKLTSGGRCWC